MSERNRTRGGGRLRLPRRTLAMAASTVAPMAAHSFSVVFEDAGEGWVYAHVPELPEVQTQGESLDQAREMVREAIALVLAEREARGERIPSKGWALVESVEIAA
jgi:predicted RNase H-like HicB family nuclease